MEIRTLRAFVEVVRQGGFSQAAKTVFATQSTVSKAVKQLENEFGVPLLDRIGHRSKLTAAGEIVVRRAQRILAERDDLIAELGELRGLKRGTLRLGLLPVGSGMLSSCEVSSTYPFVVSTAFVSGVSCTVIDCETSPTFSVVFTVAVRFAWTRIEGTFWVWNPSCVNVSV